MTGSETSPSGQTPSSRPLGVPAGTRVYAIGDIHGRRDLFEAIIDAIERDDAASQHARTEVILLGDLVDRGPDSAGVLSLAREWGTGRSVRMIAGNHEEMFLASFRDREVLRRFLRFGGRETLLSYGIEPGTRPDGDLRPLQRLMQEKIPREDLEFIRSFEDLIIMGDYAFVHAGIAPGVSVGQQSLQDLRWIREPFLSHPEMHSHVIVHGHTIVDHAEFHRNRIGIDTGAFHSGCLTALVLESTARRLIETCEVNGVISVRARKVEE